MKREWKIVVWDSYWIKNSPSLKAMGAELKRLQGIQNSQDKFNVHPGNSSMIIRQTRINLLLMDISIKKWSS